MREIKFRAWEMPEKRMMYGEQEWFDDMVAWRFQHFEEGELNPETDIILMQFTGLLDKNEKEIFEDDIVMLLGKPTRVYYENGGFRIDALSKSSLIYLKENNVELEVIGNIYENPNLLTNQENETNT